MRLKTSSRSFVKIISLPAPRFRAESKDRSSGRASHGGRLTGGQLFKAGDSVRQTGIYEVTHDREHRASHDVVMLASDVFPPCETCDQLVRFRLVRTAPYIFQDEDFEKQDG